MIPAAISAITFCLLLAIAIPAAILSHGDSDLETSAGSQLADEVREAPLRDASAETESDSVVALRDSLELGLDLSTKADALSQAATALDQSVEALWAQGYGVGYYVTTPDGQEVLSLNPDQLFYAASSIKGPFVLRAFPDGVPDEYHGLVESAIQWSDNDAYYRLRDYRGYDVLADQLEELGVEGFTRTMSFIWMTPRQLESLWVKNLGALGLDGEAGEWLRETFSETDNSAIAALPAQDAVPVTSAYGKAGWIETGELHCTVDAGVVTLGDPAGAGETGPTYVMAVMTDKGEDFDALANVVNALVSYLNARAALG